MGNGYSAVMTVWKPVLEPARPASLSEEFLPRHSLTTANLIDLMQINQETFSRMFKTVPSNAANAGIPAQRSSSTGQQQKIRAKPVLFKALTDNEKLIRAHAAWALGQVGERMPGSWKGMREEPVERVQLEIQWALDVI